jgi:hypothetical protein
VQVSYFLFPFWVSFQKPSGNLLGPCVLPAPPCSWSILSELKSKEHTPWLLTDIMHIYIYIYSIYLYVCIYIYYIFKYIYIYIYVYVYGKICTCKQHPHVNECATAPILYTCVFTHWSGKGAALQKNTCQAITTSPSTDLQDLGEGIYVHTKCVGQHLL